MTPAVLRRPYGFVFAACYVVWAVPEVVAAVRRRRRGDAAADRGSTAAIYGAVALLVAGGAAYGYRRI